MTKNSTKPKQGRPILLTFEAKDDRRITKFAAVNGLKRASAVRLLALRALTESEKNDEGRAA